MVMPKKGLYMFILMGLMAKNVWSHDIYMNRLFSNHVMDKINQREEENTMDLGNLQPSFAFIQGGAGEGEQKIGPMNSPNENKILPLIDSVKYDIPPNPCVPGQSFLSLTISSKLFKGLECSCNSSFRETQDIDCTDPQVTSCCIKNLPDLESFVSEFQQQQQHKTEQAENLNELEENPYRNGEERGGLVAKKYHEKRAFNLKKEKDFFENMNLNKNIM